MNKMVEQLKKLMSNETPFIVMKYYKGLALSRSGGFYDKNDLKSVYELFYMKGRREHYKILNRESIIFIRDNFDKIKSKMKNENGEVFEFNDFKKHLKSSFDVSFIKDKETHQEDQLKLIKIK